MTGKWLLCWLLTLFALTLSADPLRVAVISDLNGSYGSTDFNPTVDAAIARIVELNPRLVINTGDMIGGQRLSPLLTGPQLEVMWQAFHAVVSKPLESARIAQAVSPGNHDASPYPSFALERKLFDAEWQQHKPTLDYVGSGRYPFYYAFRLAGVLFIGLDIAATGQLDQAQLAWLQQLLSEHGRSARWRVIFGHVPLHPFSNERQAEVLDDPVLAQLLIDADIDLFLSGHHHAFYPGYRDGTAFIGQACLGAAPRTLMGDAARQPRGVTMLEFDDQSVAVGLLSGDRVDRWLDVRQLPATLNTAGHLLQRLDRVEDRRFKVIVE